MTKRIFAVLLTVLMLLPIIGVFSVGAETLNAASATRDFTAEQEVISQMGKAYAKSPNGIFELYVHEKTGAMGILNTKTGEIMLSNPLAYCVPSEDVVSDSTWIERSQLTIDYTTIKEQKSMKATSYNDCFAKNRQVITKVDNGIKVDYLLIDATNARFEISVIYEVTDTGFKATADASTLKYDKSLCYVNTISILPSFASVQKTDVGYIFLPDGSGTLVRFEDIPNKSYQGNISSDMYGNDYALNNIKIKNAEQFTMPVFGLVNNSISNGIGYFAIIEDGDALARITSDNTGEYISAYTSFKIVSDDVYDLPKFTGGKEEATQIKIYAANGYEGKCIVNYNMLVSEETAKNHIDLGKTYDTTYVGMAKLYRQYLIDNGSLTKLTDANEDAKLFVEVFGSIVAEEKIATFPVTVNKPLTSFEDVKTMQKYFANEDNANEITSIKNISFILKGFTNGGIVSRYPVETSWQEDLGGYWGMVDLLNDAKVKGYEVSPDVDFVYSYGTSNDSGYSDGNNAAKTLDGRYTTKRVYYAATQIFERTGAVVVSNSFYYSAYSKFYYSIAYLDDLDTLAVRTLGSDLNSDLDMKDAYNREQAKDNVVEALKAMKGVDGRKPYNLIVNKGNAYTIPYASAILEAGLDSSRRGSASEAVPFFGMVYHGSKEFAGNALNTEGDSRYMFLKALENGASLYYTLAMQNYERFKFDSEFNKYYSISYNHLKQSIVETYNEFNQLMKGKQDNYIDDHIILNGEYGYEVYRVEDGALLCTSQVVLVIYDDGEGFFLNYNDYSVTVVYEGKTYSINGLGYAKYSNTTQEEGGTVNG